MYGHCNLDKIAIVQNIALRVLVGVHQFPHNLSFNAEMGWIPYNIGRHTETLRMWNRLFQNGR